MYTKATVLPRTTGSALFLLILITALISGCATVPTPLAGDHFSPITPKDAVAEKSSGKEVRWGGQIFAVEPGEDRTCFAVLSRALLNDARPNKRGNTNGTFIACRPGFFDPALYPDGSDITVVGTVSGIEQYQSGYDNYELAKVDATEIYLWPEYRLNSFAAFDWYPIFDSCAYAWDYYCLGGGYYSNVARYCPYGHHHHHPHPANTAGYGRIATTINRIVQGGYDDREAVVSRSWAVRGGYIATGAHSHMGGYGGVRIAAYGGRGPSGGGARSGSGGNPGGRSSSSSSSGGSSGGSSAAAASSSVSVSSSGGGGRSSAH